MVNIFLGFFAEATELGTVVRVVESGEMLLGRCVASVGADAFGVAAIECVGLVNVDISIDAEVLVLAHIAAGLGGRYGETACVGRGRGVQLNVRVNFLAGGAADIGLGSVVVQLAEVLTRRNNPGVLEVWARAALDGASAANRWARIRWAGGDDNRFA